MTSSWKTQKVARLNAKFVTLTRRCLLSLFRQRERKIVAELKKKSRLPVASFCLRCSQGKASTQTTLRRLRRRGATTRRCRGTAYQELHEAIRTDTAVPRRSGSR